MSSGDEIVVKPSKRPKIDGGDALEKAANSDSDTNQDVAPANATTAASGKEGEDDEEEIDEEEEDQEALPPATNKAGKGKVKGKGDTAASSASAKDGDEEEETVATKGAKGVKGKPK